MNKQVEEKALPLNRNNLINILKAMNDGIYIVNQRYDIEFINHVIQKEFGEIAGRKCYTYFRDRTEPCPWCKNKEVFAGKTVHWKWYSFKNKKHYDLLGTPMKNLDGTISKLEIFHDITERKQKEEKLKKQNRELSSLNAIAATISQSLELDKVLADTLKTVLDLMHLKAGWIFLKEEDGDRLTLAGHLGLSPEFAREEAERPQGDCICSHVIRKKEPLIAENILECPRLSKSVTKKEGLACHASIPLMSKNKVAGVMNVASEEYHPFLPEDLALLSAIGHQVGVAIENARLFENTRKTSSELEESYERVKSLYEELKEEKEKAKILKKALEERFGLGNILGKNHQMQAIYDLIENISPGNSTILIQGESGTGKELVAKSLHYNSPRKNRPLIAVNCSAFAETLLESELFGHEKGAFTGASSLKKGRFEISDQGTLFLDEIGELPISLQTKLLRVLQEKTIERVGGTLPIPVDFRLIAATNKNLEDEVKNGNFREDLYYRLNVVKTVIPPLRERSEDIPLLIKHFIDKYTNEQQPESKVSGITPEAVKILCDYQWKGNVRELENVLERCILLGSGDMITPSELPLQVRQNVSSFLDLDGIPQDVGLAETLAAVEKRMIQRAMKLSGNVQTKAAKLLGIGKSGLNQKLKKFNLG